MKECPICKAKCFDDMEVCYGCLHEFDQEQTLQREAVVDEDLLQDDPFEPLEYNDAPLAQPKGASINADGPAFRLEIPSSLKTFTIRCEGLQIEGSLA